MHWLKCVCKGTDLLGAREGHCAACFHVRKSDATNECTDVVLVIGGYCDGELSSDPIIAELHNLPILQWTKAQIESYTSLPLLHECTKSISYENNSKVSHLEREQQEQCKCQVVCEEREMWSTNDIFTVDGATLTSMGDNCALLFGGLNELCERRNNTFCITITSTHTFAEYKHSCVIPSCTCEQNEWHEKLEEEHHEEREEHGNDNNDDDDIVNKSNEQLLKEYMEKNMYEELEYMVHVEEVYTYGDVPPARSRHSAASLLTSQTLIVFGGETDEADQSNDMYTLNLHTRLWRRIEHLYCYNCRGFLSCQEHTNLSNTTQTVTNEKIQSSVSCTNWPAARFNSSLAVIQDKFIVLYGGAHFVDGCMSSLNDVWLFDLLTCTWHAVPVTSNLRNSECSAHSLEWPRCNGHAGITLHGISSRNNKNDDHNYEDDNDDYKIKRNTINATGCKWSRVFFVGGKDVITGCNSVKCVEVSEDGQCTLSLREPLVWDAATEEFVKVDTCAWCHDMWHRVENNNSNNNNDKKETELSPEVVVEEIDINNVGWPVWRYCSAVVITAHNNLLVLAGQCRHPQPTSAYILCLDEEY